MPYCLTETFEGGFGGLYPNSNSELLSILVDKEGYKPIAIAGANISSTTGPEV